MSKNEKPKPKLATGGLVPNAGPVIQAHAGEYVDAARRYVVTGIHPVCGHQPGATFSAVLPAEQERALIDGGALRRADSKQ